MARKRKKSRRYRYRSYQTSRRGGGFPRLELELEPQVFREIIAVLLIGLGLFILLAILGMAGRIGEIVYPTLRLTFGWSGFVLPLVLVGSGVALFYPIRRALFKTATTAGLVLFMVTLSALLHLPYHSDSALEVAGLGDGGGYLGFLVNRSLISLVDIWAALIILAVAFLVSLLLIFGQPLKNLYYRFRLNLPSSPLPKLKIRVNDHFPATPGTSPAEAVEEEEKREKKGGLFKRRTTKKEEESEFVPTYRPADPDWAPPPLDLLSDQTTKVDSGNITNNINIIEDTLAEFGIEVEMAEVNVGPTVTQYTLRPATGVKLSRITALTNDLALALAAHPLRIEAPIPGRSLVGIEVPNRRVALVRLREILESETFKRVRSPLTMALGRDVAGIPVASDLIRMPHLLIAGATGAGKSVFLTSLLVASLYRNSPADLRLVLVDPKRVEFTSFNDVPHLLAPVIVEPAKTINALKWLVLEMERRYRVLQEAGVRNIESYNRYRQGGERLPYIALIVDELADLMAVSAREVEAYICRLAQLSRAVGIHLVIATQRPSVDVITGLIKANFPSRIAFNVTSGTDSRTILDTVGAEKLLGNGDMLFLPSELAKPKRIQGVYVSDREVKAVTNHLKGKAGVGYGYVEEVTAEVKGVPGSPLAVSDEGDEFLDEAAELIVRTGKASASYLQRRFRIGYARAARLLDLLEQRGIVGPGEGAKPREILVDRAEFLGEKLTKGDEDEEFEEGEDF